MHTLFAVFQAVSSSNDGLTWSELVANIPLDPFTVFTLVLLAGGVGGILWIGRSRTPPTKSTP